MTIENHNLPNGDPLATDGRSSPSYPAIAEGVLARKARGVWVLAAGTLNVVDGEGVTQSLAAGFFNAGTIYPIQIVEVLTGTTLTGRLVY